MENKSLINKIKKPQDLKSFDIRQLNALADEIRDYLLNLKQTNDVHLSSNLGIIEISIGSIYCFDIEKDKIVYDTGHQCYTHKILTERSLMMNTVRKNNGISGFISRTESKYDVLNAGHTGTALAVSKGLIFNNVGDYVVCIVGDASIVNGQSFEALNYFNINQKRLIIVLNDNGMSISKSIGAIAKSLNKIKLSSAFFGAEKTAKKIFSPKKDSNKFFKCLFNSYNFLEQKIAGKNLFQILGYQYLGPIDGNDIKKVIKGYKKAMWYSMQGPVVLHFKTKKGLGLKEAYDDKNGNFHSTSIKPQNLIGKDIADFLSTKVDKNKKINVINPAMTLNTGFLEFSNNYPNNYHDVGIAEEFAISYATGMSLNGLQPIVVVYSSFLTRGFDQILSDWQNNSLSILCLIDRADLSTGDGNSHHGIYDVNLLKNVSNASIISFRNNNQMKSLINIAINQNQKSYFIRYPKSYFNKIDNNDNNYQVIDGEWEKVITKENNDVCIISYGPYVNLIEKYIIDNNLNTDLINAIFINDFHESNLLNLKKYKKIIVYERIYQPCLYWDVLEFFKNFKTNVEIHSMCYKVLPTFGSLDFLDKTNMMDIESLMKKLY